MKICEVKEMKKIFFSVVVLLLLFAPFAIAVKVTPKVMTINNSNIDSNSTSDNDSDDELTNENDSNATSCGRIAVAERLRSRHMFDMGTSIAKLAEMQAVIDVGVENGVDVSELEAIIAEVKEKFDALDINDEEAYGNLISEIKELISDFREAAHEIVELKEFSAQINEQVRESRQQTEGEVNALREQAKVKASTTALAVFDLHVCNTERKIQALQERDMNGTLTSGANEKFGEVKVLREKLNEALRSGDKEEVKLVDKEIKDTWANFRQAFLGAQKNIVNEYKKKVSDRLDKIKGKFDELKEDTSDLENNARVLMSNIEAMEKRMGSKDMNLTNGSVEKSNELIRNMQKNFEAVKNKHSEKIMEKIQVQQQNLKAENAKDGLVDGNKPVDSSNNGGVNNG